MIKRIAIIAHGRLHTNRVLSAITGSLQSSVFFTEYHGHAIELAAQLAPQHDILVVAGGDGSLSEVVNGVMQHPLHRRPAVCIVPMGTGNDVARALGVRLQAKEVIGRVTKGQTVPWDVLRIEYTSEIKGTNTLASQDVNTLTSQQVRYCANVASLGLGGRVAQLFTNDLRKLPGHLGYFAAIIKGFSSYRPVSSTLTLTLNGTTHTITQQRLIVALCNSKFFGSGLGIAPGALPSDGVIEVVDIGNVGVMQYLRHLPRLRHARPLHDPKISYCQSTECRLDSEEPIPIEIDGEYVGTTPVLVSIEQHAVSML